MLVNLESLASLVNVESLKVAGFLHLDTFNLIGLTEWGMQHVVQSSFARLQQNVRHATVLPVRTETLHTKQRLVTLYAFTANSDNRIACKRVLM